MSEEEERALTLILEEMRRVMRSEYSPYDNNSEIYAEISAALKIWGVTV